MKKVRNILFKILTCILILITAMLMFVAAYNFITVKILHKDYPNLFGYTFFEIVSGSMFPYIEKGDMIIVKLDTEYNVGDVVSFKDNDSIITHRIVEKHDDYYVTKGDSNSTVDNSIREDQIIGKTVKVFSRAFIIAKVLTTPKVFIACLITITLICWCIALFKKEVKSEKRKSSDRVDVMEIIKNNNRLKVEIVILLFLLIVLCFLIPFTLSRFRTEARSDATMDIAFYLLNDTYTHQNITLYEMSPGDERTYNFSVSNTDGTNRSEVTLDFEVVVLATTNMPLEYELYQVESGIDTNAVSSSDTITDDDGMYFKEFKTSLDTFEYDADSTNYYKLVIKYPSQYKHNKYQGISENVEIKILSRQKI